MVNDPISDYLTRVRNAIAAQHAEVEVPASRLKKEMTRILAEQGYISEYVLEPTPVGEAIRIKLKYTRRAPDGDQWAEARVASGPASLRHPRGDTARPGRDGDGDPLDLGWRDDGP